MKKVINISSNKQNTQADNVAEKYIQINFSE